MNNPLIAETSGPLFDDLEVTPEAHFRLHYFGAVLVCLERAAAADKTFEAILERFPFLVGYNNELAQRLAGLPAAEAFTRWCAALVPWEQRATVHLPLRALRPLLGGEAPAVMCLLSAGLIEEDARFGGLFEFLQGSSAPRRPTVGLLRQCWADYVTGTDFTRLVRRARSLGLWQPVNADAAQPDLAVQIPPAMWEAMRGDEDASPPAWASYREPGALLPLAELVLAPDDQAALAALPRLLDHGEVRVVVVRSAHRNGRHTVLGALARALGRGMLEMRSTEKIDPDRWREAAALAQLRHALPVATFDLGPGETLALPEDWPAGVPLGLVLGRQGGLTGELTAEAVTLSLELPDPAAREVHWARSLAPAPSGQLAGIAQQYRLPAGQIHRAARIARMRAALADRPQPAGRDVLEALRTLNRQTLDALARRMPAEGDWSQLCASPLTFRELEHLEGRCRHREKLPTLLASSPSVGVRALFTGPSGTGKTHAARLLAARLQKDLYQLDLSAVVNKYIGETEKNLNRVLEAAEELDVILLLDEGDALLAPRTEVQGANDRYANLETNFLLQRIESYQGIMVVTTNARARIDAAFERRMDVTVEFYLPDAEQRWALWQLHLPALHEVAESFLGEVASRCEFTGGQIRNTALHAALLALDDGGLVRTSALEAAIRREYAKLGSVCPLRHLASNP